MVTLTFGQKFGSLSITNAIFCPVQTKPRKLWFWTLCAIFILNLDNHMFKDEYLIAVWKSELSIDKGPFLRFCRMSITNASNLLITQKLKMQWSKVFGFFWSLSIDPTWHKQFVLVPILIKSENNKTFSKVSITNEIFAPLCLCSWPKKIF